MTKPKVTARIPLRRDELSVGDQMQRLVAVDWSGRVDVAGQRRHIWAGVWTQEANGAAKVTLEAGRTREEMGDWLIEMANETPRMAVSVDCCFSYPAWFLREHGCESVFAFWQKAAGGYAEKWLKRERLGELADLQAKVEDAVAEPRDERFWGAPHKRPAVFCGEGLRSMYRETDYENKIAQALAGGDAERAAKMRGITPKSPFQIGGSGSVGTGSLRAMPFLLKLRAAGFRVWPFEDAALNAARPRPLLLEMYTRLMTGAVAKSNEAARTSYMKARRKNDVFYTSLPRGVVAKAVGSEDAFDALVSVLEMARWRDQFAGLRRTRDEDLKLEGITWRPGVRG